MLCKARNMPPDHNGDSAYFSVAADPAPFHGMLLTCNWPKCLPIHKFVYCLFCR